MLDLLKATFQVYMVILSYLTLYKWLFMMHPQIVLHTPVKKPAQINCATQHHHLVTKFLTRDEAKRKRIHFRDIMYW